MVRWFKRSNGSRPLRQRSDPPAQVQRLEGRVLFSHLGHVVTLPAASEYGRSGLEVAFFQAPADHHRSRFRTVTWIDPMIDP